MSVSTYAIQKNLIGKTVEITVGDQMTPVEAERFVKEFSATVASINTAQFQLVIDSTNMKVLTPEMATKLEGAMALYNQAGFGKILIKLQDNPILKMQASRIARKVGLASFEIIG
ncbi:MAG: hypothetical protein ABS951_13310 [Solibacillus sp.]